MYRNIDNLSVLCYYCSNTVINGGMLTALSVFMEFEPEFLSEVVKEIKKRGHKICSLFLQNRTVLIIVSIFIIVKFIFRINTVSDVCKVRHSCKTGAYFFVFIDQHAHISSR